MFGWRRRSEGFEWREYVRTTVLVRRADRQRRLDDARLAALAKVKDVADVGVDVGRASVSAARSQLSRLLSVIGEAILDIAVAVFWATARWAKFGWDVLKDSSGAVLRPLIDIVRVPADAARDKIKMMPDLARNFPIKAHHLISAALALGLIYVGGPMLRSADGVGAAVAPLSGDGSGSGGGSGQVTISSEISGRATGVTGDLMRVDGTFVRLEGIEAPASAQPCYRENGRRWNCASAARSGLAKIIRGHQVTCTPSGKDESGRTLANCVVDGTTDVATELVRNGYVFATSSSYFNSLSSAEETARNAKVGIWQGEVVRPQEWRDQAWEAAKRAAPDGCPIKGVVRASNKIYALPWSDAYANARIRPDRGERWFCSEDAAKAAGFLPLDKS
jgi:endonuclease YncB( thermonuclease family)